MYRPGIDVPDHSPTPATAKTRPGSRGQARRRTPPPDCLRDRVRPSRSVLPPPYFRIALPILLLRPDKEPRLPHAHPVAPTPTHAGPSSPQLPGGRLMPE